MNPDTRPVARRIGKLSFLVAGALLACGCSTFSPDPYDTPAYYLDEYGMVYGPDPQGHTTLQASPGAAGLTLAGRVSPYDPFWGIYPGPYQRGGYLYAYPFVAYSSRPPLPAPPPDPVAVVPVASPAPPMTRLPRMTRPVTDLATEPRLPPATYRRGEAGAGMAAPRARPRPASGPDATSRPAPTRPARATRPSRPAAPRTPPPGRPRVIDP